MRKTRTASLRLNNLENRLTPAATLNFLSGNLTVTGDFQSNTIIIGTDTVGAKSGAVSVYVVGGKNLVADYNADPTTFYATYAKAPYAMGTFKVTGSITLNGNNSNDFVVVTIEDNASLSGNISVSLGNGADDVIIQNQALTLGSKGGVPGSITMNGGLGADNLSLIGIQSGGLVNVNGGGTGFRPGQQTPLAPGDVFRVFDSTLNNMVIVRDSITALDDTFGPSTVGSLVVNNPAVSPQGGFVVSGISYPATYTKFGDKGYSGLLVIDPGSSVAGNVTYAGSSSNDGVYIRGTVGGTVTVPGQAGDNDYVQTGLVAGNVSFIGGSGIDSVSFGAGAAVVSGGVQLTLFDGDNAYDLSNPFSVNGPFTVYAGNGNDNVGSVGGFISGNINLNLGNGDNTVVWNGFGGGSRFDYQGGGGKDSLTINNANAFAVYATFGAGADSFSYGAGALVASARLDFGVDFDTDSYDDSLTSVFWSTMLINYP